MVKSKLPTGYLTESEGYTINEIDTGDCPYDQLVLWNAIRKARDSYLDRWEINETETSIIDGYCHEHAECLLKALIDVWTGSNTANQTRKNPYVQFGSVTSHLRSDQPANSVDTIDEVNEAGCGHYWVVAPLENDPDSPRPPTDIDQYTADMYAHSRGETRNPLLTAGSPPDYLAIDDAWVPAGMIRQVDGWWRDHL